MPYTPKHLAEPVIDRPSHDWEYWARQQEVELKRRLKAPLWAELERKERELEKIQRG
jgi:hypothetical protein